MGFPDDLSARLAAKVSQLRSVSQDSLATPNYRGYAGCPTVLYGGEDLFQTPRWHVRGGRNEVLSAPNGSRPGLLLSSQRLLTELSDFWLPHQVSDITA